jgi:hypothetical protein
MWIRRTLPEENPDISKVEQKFYRIKKPDWAAAQPG